ncbi:MAG: hypothetical protein HYX87_05575 [Chloroflexi bacterium]|nr:hypothetical protein [Chloroflexota bacterium]
MSRMEQQETHDTAEQELEEQVRASLVEGKLPCSGAFEIARKLKVNRRKVGDAANRMRIRIVNCQLGCFQTLKATHDDLAGMNISDALIGRVMEESTDGVLSCPTAFKVAGSLKATPKEVGDAATMQKVKIVGCQLGCF